MYLLHGQVPAHVLGEWYACMGHEKELQKMLYMYFLHLLIRDNISHACIFFVHDGIALPKTVGKVGNPKRFF